jgi:hypothetical protein
MGFGWSGTAAFSSYLPEWAFDSSWDKLVADHEAMRD